jgi:RNA polymerase sigma factor (sigma-70 family)
VYQVTPEQIQALAGRIASRIHVRPSYYSHEDVVQDACTILLQQEYPPESGIEELAWRFRSCVSSLRDLLKHKIRQMVELPEGGAPVEPIVPDERLDRQAMMAASGLTQIEQAILVARYDESLTQQEIADRFGYCQQTVNAYIHNALDKLRGQYTKNHLCPGPVLPTLAGRKKRGRPRKGAGTVANGRESGGSNLDRSPATDASAERCAHPTGLAYAE